MLPAVTGSVGKPGGGFLYLNGIETRGSTATTSSGARSQPARGADQPDGPGRRSRGPRPVPGAVLLEHQHRRLDPEQRRLTPPCVGRTSSRRRRPLPDDTADLATLSSPPRASSSTTTWSSLISTTVSGTVKAVDPPARPFRTPRSSAGCPPDGLRRAGAVRERQRRLDRLLADAGSGRVLMRSPSADDVAGRPDPASVRRRPLSDPSGRIEIVSERAEADGHSRLPLCELTPAGSRSPPALVARLVLDAQRQLRQRSRRPWHAGSQVVCSIPPMRRPGAFATATWRSSGARRRAHRPGLDDPGRPRLGRSLHKATGRSSSRVHHRERLNRAEVDMAESSAVHGIEVAVASGRRSSGRPAGCR